MELAEWTVALQLGSWWMRKRAGAGSGGSGWPPGQIVLIRTEAKYINLASETETSRSKSAPLVKHVLWDFIYILAVVDFMERERNYEQGQRLCGTECEGSVSSV